MLLAEVGVMGVGVGAQAIWALGNIWRHPHSKLQVNHFPTLPLSAASFSSPASSLTISSQKLSLTDVLISQKRKWLCREEITPPLGN